MKNSTRWFGWTALMLPLHMCEQLIFGIGELGMLKRILAHYYAWFRQADYGTVVLVATVGTLVCALTFGILLGGTWKDTSLGVWSLIAIGEIHHVFESLSAGHYTPGTATAIPYVVFGVLLMFAIRQERRERARLTAPFDLKQLLAVLTLLLMGVKGFAQTSAPQSDDFVIRKVRIFDGSRVLQSSDVWVRNGKIEAVGPNLAVPSGMPVIDGTGKTLLPGLIDAHVHTVGKDNFLRSALALGVTTELDMGAAPKYADQIEREQAEGKHLDFADLRSSRTQPTAPDGHGTEYGIAIPTVATPADAQPLVDALVAEDADFIGEIVYDDGSEYGLHIPTLSKESLRAVIEAAHRHGKLAVVHVLALQAAKDAVAAGADGLVHLFADRPPDDEFVSLVVQHHTFVIPTLSVLASAAGVSAGPSLARNPRLAPYLTSEALADLMANYPRNAGSLNNAEEAVRRLHTAGVPILAGTDAHNLGTAHGASLHSELQMLVGSGLTPVEALASATSVNAASFQLSDRGQIVADKRADLLLVAGDPTTQISDINNVVAVWKLGVQDDREGHRAALDKAKDAEQAQRTAPAPAGSELGLISDFENGIATSRFGLGWHVSAGTILGGHKPNARITVVDGGAENSAKALQISGEITPGTFGWAGTIFFPGPAPMAPVNLSSKKAIGFWAKGDGRTYQVMLSAKCKGAMPIAKSFTAGPEWKQVTIPISEFGIDGSDLQSLMIAEVGIPGAFGFQIDNVRLESSDTTAVEVIPAKPEASPPSHGGPSLSGVEIQHHADREAATKVSSSTWEIDHTSYLWLQGLHGTVDALGHRIGYKASPADLMTRADVGLQSVIGAQHGRFGMLSDVLWTPITIKQSNSLLKPAPAMLAKAKYTPVIITPEVDYRLIDRRNIQIDGLTGFRYWHLGTDITLTPAAGGTALNKSVNWFDPLVGARITVPLTPKLTATILGDAGGWGVGSQLDYQMAAALSYKIKPRWAIDTGWRYMYSDYNDSLFRSRLTQSGIVIGVTYHIKGRHAN